MHAVQPGANRYRIILQEESPRFHVCKRWVKHSPLEDQRHQESGAWQANYAADKAPIRHAVGWIDPAFR
jgi:hypothetical protein